MITINEKKNLNYFVCSCGKLLQKINARHLKTKYHINHTKKENKVEFENSDISIRHKQEQCNILIEQFNKADIEGDPFEMATIWNKFINDKIMTSKELVEFRYRHMSNACDIKQQRFEQMDELIKILT
jgi:hypothetical protein|tara:strand:- start:144 stop:527 length:384 start_codon:yes stop_codon:yes gene_type:complete